MDLLPPSFFTKSLMTLLPPDYFINNLAGSDIRAYFKNRAPKSVYSHCGRVSRPSSALLLPPAAFCERFAPAIFQEVRPSLPCFPSPVEMILLLPPSYFMAARDRLHAISSTTSINQLTAESAYSVMSSSFYQTVEVHQNKLDEQDEYVNGKC